MFGMMFWNIAFGATRSAVLPTWKTAVTTTTPLRPTAEALAFSQRTKGAEAPLALIRQVEYIAEKYRHVREERIAEWPVEFLRRPRRTQNTIPDFLTPNAVLPHFFRKTRGLKRRVDNWSTARLITHREQVSVHDLANQRVADIRNLHRVRPTEMPFHRSDT